MKIVSVKKLSKKEKQSVFELWNEEYPIQLTYKTVSDLDAYLNNLSEQSHYFALDDKNQITGWAFVFKRENETWFAIIVSKKHQKKGLGAALLNQLKTDYRQLNGWVIDHENYALSNGKIYPTPLGFYLKSGFKLLRQTRLEIPILSAVKIRWNK